VILAGDTGGTKTLLALCNDYGVPQKDEMFHCAEFDSLEAIVDKFMHGNGNPRVEGACFGVAGPVVDHTAKITNLPWSITEEGLSRQLGGAPVTLLNDLQATALGALALPDTAFAVLQPQAAPALRGTVGIVAPGTGFGEALLVHDGKRYIALPSEGGHSDFAPGTDEEVELWRFLQALHGKHVSNERVLSGNGIGDLYAFARQRSGEPEPAWLTSEIKAGDRNAVVAKAGVAGTDAACVHALDLFATLLGAEAGNHALRGFATRGVVIGGGIGPKILPKLQSGALVARFSDKGRFAGWLKTLGVRVCLEPKAALYGAAHHVISSKDMLP
jgi:glucokinase